MEKTIIEVFNVNLFSLCSFVSSCPTVLPIVFLDVNRDTFLKKRDHHIVACIQDHTPISLLFAKHVLGMLFPPSVAGLLSCRWWASWVHVSVRWCHESLCRRQFPLLSSRNAQLPSCKATSHLPSARFAPTCCGMPMVSILNHTIRYQFYSFGIEPEMSMLLAVAHDLAHECFVSAC